MSTTNTGTDNIDLAPENDNFDDAHVDVHTNDDDTGDATGQGNVPATDRYSYISVFQLHLATLL